MFEEEKVKKLWKKSRKGNREAFDQFYLSTVRILYAYGKQLHVDTGLVEDCIQELFVGLWKNRRNIKIKHSAKQYLFLSLRRLIIRKANKTSETPTEQGILDAQYFAPSLTQSIETDSQKRKSEVENAIQDLPKRQKEALFLKYYEGFDYEEIAGVMGLQKHGVYKLVSQAIKKLRNRLTIFF